MLKTIWKLILVIAVYLNGQTIQINEVVSSNQSSFFDEDGDTPDWIELYNPSQTSISLNNWGISDSPASPFKWRFQNTSIGPEEFLLIMASDKDRADIISDWETVIDWVISGTTF